MKTEQLIAQLVGSLEPVKPLPPPLVRLLRWTAACLPVVAVGVLLIGPRADVSIAMRQPPFVTLLVLALATGIVSAGSALASGVPAADRSVAHRAGPFLICGLWIATLVALLVNGGDALARLTAMPVHLLCIVEIAAFSVVPGWALMAMLRRAAPLEPIRSALLAMLGATAIAVAATQVLCPIDEPEHHLAGHLAPMVLMTILAAAARRRSLVWR